MAAYYNENEPYAAAWIRNLIVFGLIAPGDVDERSIEDVKSDDLEGYDQYHFFAGIGGWSHALRLAGWPDDRPVWTGSCPCQPFSAAGKQRGTADDRHLWPVWRGLIAERRPPKVFGEQVASPLGREWLAGVRLDMEALGYAVGAADLCAAGVSAPHVRQRLFWVADSKSVYGDEWVDLHLGVEGQIQPQDYGKVPDLWVAAPSPTDCLAYGIPEDVGSVRAYGNAIVPQVAAEFIAAYMETERDMSLFL